MPALSDLFNITPGAISTAPQRMRNLPPPPVKPKWDIRSGLPEPGLEQVTPEEWLPPGAGMKLAALAKGGIAPLAAAALAKGGIAPPAVAALAKGGIAPLAVAALAKGGIAPLAAGIIKNRGGVWLERELPDFVSKELAPNVSSEASNRIMKGMSPEQFTELESKRNINLSSLNNVGREMWNKILASDAVKRHMEDPSYLPHLQIDPDVAFIKWARGPLRNYITRDMATEGDPIRALAEQGITHLPDSKIKSLPATSEYDLPKLREEQGFPAKEVAKTKLGRIWERMADSRVVPGKENEYGDTVYSYRNYMRYPKGDPDFLGLTNIIREGMKRGAIDPASVSRGNFTVEAAVRYADKIRKEMAKAKMAPDVFKEYPETGHKWVQLNRPGQFADESDAMRHSVRGYEPPELGLGGHDGYGAGGFPAIESGEAKIFSLRTPTGKPAVTVEVVRDPDGVYRISQIKGHADSSPKPEYSQMIEDLKKQFEQR